MPQEKRLQLEHIVYPGKFQDALHQKQQDKMSILQSTLNQKRNQQQQQLMGKIDPIINHSRDFHEDVPVANLMKQHAQQVQIFNKLTIHRRDAQTIKTKQPHYEVIKEDSNIEYEIHNKSNFLQDQNQNEPSFSKNEETADNIDITALIDENQELSDRNSGSRRSSNGNRPPIPSSKNLSYTSQYKALKDNPSKANQQALSRRSTQQSAISNLSNELIQNNRSSDADPFNRIQYFDQDFHDDIHIDERVSQDETAEPAQKNLNYVNTRLLPPKPPKVQDFVKPEASKSEQVSQRSSVSTNQNQNEFSELSTTSFKSSRNTSLLKKDFVLDRFASTGSLQKLQQNFADSSILPSVSMEQFQNPATHDDLQHSVSQLQNQSHLTNGSTEVSGRVFNEQLNDNKEVQLKQDQQDLDEKSVSLKDPSVRESNVREPENSIESQQQIQSQSCKIQDYEQPIQQVVLPNITEINEAQPMISGMTVSINESDILDQMMANLQNETDQPNNVSGNLAHPSGNSYNQDSLNSSIDVPIAHVISTKPEYLLSSNLKFSQNMAKQNINQQDTTLQEVDENDICIEIDIQDLIAQPQPYDKVKSEFDQVVDELNAQIQSVQINDNQKTQIILQSEQNSNADSIFIQADYQKFNSQQMNQAGIVSAISDNDPKVLQLASPPQTVVQCTKPVDYSKFQFDVEEPKQNESIIERARKRLFGQQKHEALEDLLEAFQSLDSQDPVQPKTPVAEDVISSFFRILDKVGDEE